MIVRTGQMEKCQKIGSWDGYPGGDAPGFAFETLEWIKRTELAALASVGVPVPGPLKAALAAQAEVDWSRE